MTPEQILREAFEARAERVQFGPDALGTIRGRIARRRGQRRRLLVSIASIGTGVAATVTAVVIGVASCAPVPSPAPPTVGTTGPGPSVGPTPGPTTTAGPSGVAVRVPVYELGRTGAPLLYREFRSTVVPADTLTDRIAGAVGLMLASPPLDPDYTTPWPAGIGVGAVTITDRVATVDLTGVAGATAIQDPAVAQAAVQQLVWTVTAVTADRNTTLTGVRVTLGGSASTTLWGVAVGGALARADAVATLGAVWVVSPQQNDVVAGTFSVVLDGAVFEAAVRLRIRNGDGTVRSDQPVLLSAGAPARGGKTVALTLPPGTYTVEAYVVSVKDGSEQSLDGHQITVMPS
jgi:hypothetical protein